MSTKIHIAARRRLHTLVAHDSASVQPKPSPVVQPAALAPLRSGRACRCTGELLHSGNLQATSAHKFCLWGERWRSLKNCTQLAVCDYLRIPTCTHFPPHTPLAQRLGCRSQLAAQHPHHYTCAAPRAREPHRRRCVP
eukprot:344303-Chlamydomonas_euryale.AAC.3